MSIKIGDNASVYGKQWIVNNVTGADKVKKEFPEIGDIMERMNLTLLV